MQKTEYKNGEDWVKFSVPDEDGEPEQWMVQSNFLLSNWTCIYGQGCPGLTPANENRYFDDIGCCKLGFWFTDIEDYEKVEKQIKNLSKEDWDDELRQYVDKNGWANIYSIDRDNDEINGKSKVTDFGCVFANRNTGSVGSTGKTGCAFHHLAARTGQDHVDVMPQVCWQLPIKYEFDDDNDRHVIQPWTVDQWGGEDEEGSHDHIMCWWCTETPDAYVGSKPVLAAMEHELREIMGDTAYDEMVRVLNARPKPAPMPGSVTNDGRPMIPLLIGNREPYKAPSATSTPAVMKKMKETGNVVVPGS